MGYNLANLPQNERDQLQADKTAAYLAWQELHGQLSTAQVDQQAAQQPASQRQYYLGRLTEHRRRLAVTITAQKTSLVSR